jgi:meromycolic acid enoyl-[acyl-carrier-protein] reductase
MGLLENKTVLVTGILTDASLAFGIAQRAQEEGATVIASGFGRGLSLTRRVVRKLPVEPAVLEIDVTDEVQLAAAAAEAASLTTKLDGLVHAIGFAPQDCLGSGMFVASPEDVLSAIHVSAISMGTLTKAFLPLLEAAGSASVVGLDFDATVAWPLYDWMGVAKAALESLNRYLARDLGPKNIRCNLVAAGPIRTMAAKSIPGFDTFEDNWQAVAPLGWDNTDGRPVADATVALLSDLLRATTGEILHVDGGVHAMGAARPADRQPD